jgi:hypothetical protein
MQFRPAVRTAFALLLIAALAPGAIRAAEPSSASTAAQPASASTAAQPASASTAAQPASASTAAEPSSASPENLPTTPTELMPLPHGRILNGHVFMPATEVPGALLTTSFLSSLLIAWGQTTGSFNVNGQVLSGHFDYAGIGAVIGYEYAFLNYFSARLALTELIFSGVTGRSALVIGTKLQGGAGAGVTFSLPVGDTLRLGVLFDVTAAPNFALTIGNGLRAVTNTCTSGPASCNIHIGGFFQQQNVVQLTPALAANWAPFSAFGVTANASYIYSNQRISGTTFTGNAVQVGTALDFDFAEVSSVPVGLQVQFSWIAPFNGSALQHVTDLGGGIFYTGRKNLALGLQLINRRFAVTPDVDVSWKTWLANIGVRYYW